MFYKLINLHCHVKMNYFDACQFLYVFCCFENLWLDFEKNQFRFFQIVVYFVSNKQVLFLNHVNLQDF